MTLCFFDTHNHIQGSEFALDRAGVIARAREAGLVGMLVLGVDVASSEAAIALAQANPGVFAAAGCHPHDAGQMDEASLRKLAELARHPAVVAVGEIGLDFYRNLSEHKRQISVLERQLDIASEVEKPIAVHGRDAHEALLPIIEAWSRRLGGARPDDRPLGVMHYFSGDAQLAQRYVDLGFLISIHTSVTYAKNKQLHDVAAKLPLAALVVETDSPYGTPQSRRGQRNEPAYVVEAVTKIAELRGEPIERVAGATTENALRVFGVAGTASNIAGAEALRGA